MATPQVLEIKLVISNLAQIKAQVSQGMAGGGTVGGAVAGAGGGFGLGGLGAFYAIHRVVNAMMGVVRAAEDMASEILNVRDVMGSTFGQASQMVGLFGVAGMSGTQMTRMAERVSIDQANPRAIGAMHALGVNPSANGIDTLNQTINALREITNSTKKANMAIQIFGLRGYASMLPILRMQQDIIDTSKELQAKLNPEFANKWEHFKELMELFGQALLIDIFIPLVSAVVPAFELLANGVMKVLNLFTEFNDFFGGFPAYILAFAGLATGIIVIATAIGKLIGVVKLLVGWTAIEQALLGNWGAIAAAAAVGIGFGVYNFQNSKQDDIADNTKQAADTLIDLKAIIVGGGGKRGNRAMGWMEAEYAIGHAMSLGG